MKKPDKAKQNRNLEHGKKKHLKQIAKNKSNKVKRLRRLADNTQKRQMEQEMFKMQEEIRKIQNKDLTIKNPVVE